MGSWLDVVGEQNRPCIDCGWYGLDFAGGVTRTVLAKAEDVTPFLLQIVFAEMDAVLVTTRFVGNHAFKPLSLEGRKRTTGIAHLRLPVSIL